MVPALIREFTIELEEAGDEDRLADLGIYSNKKQELRKWDAKVALRWCDIVSIQQTVRDTETNDDIDGTRISTINQQTYLVADDYETLLKEWIAYTTWETNQK
jgi:hypothetical protein